MLLLGNFVLVLESKSLYRLMHERRVIFIVLLLGILFYPNIITAAGYERRFGGGHVFSL